MMRIEKNKRELDIEYINLYRRISIREVVRIQWFPDDFEFIYDDLNNGYKMVGNAVPVELVRNIEISIKNNLTDDVLKKE